ncbi:hypothetical protein RHMOL_Rhmol05G0091700 [Rhododendron molle]|uniref:Uncharacterized protein n=1 Tax=Rhododendron molle TaxID=49168 RepID=A0ACC0NN81_RHOML|nr:hypothetical protein RHMOL_Rhmol05G0091700 [Rhododendron molle]
MVSEYGLALVGNLADRDEGGETYFGLVSMCRLIQRRVGKNRGVCVGRDASQELSFCFKKPGSGEEHGKLFPFVSFGAWLVSSNTGAAAWVMETGEVDVPYQAVQCKASSATLVEITAGLMVLQWAIQQKMERICIKTDCEVFVQGLMDWQSAPFDVQPALSDFCSLCSNFLVVKVIKVSRLVVKVAHSKAKAALSHM